jgi:hypothetical protein
MNEFELELEAALGGTEADTSMPIKDQVERGHVALGEDQATQWGAQLNAARRKAREVAEAHSAAVERLNAVTNARLEALAVQEAWLEEALQVYHEVKLAEDPEGYKTIILPTVTLKSGTWGGDVWTWEDSAFEPWAVENLPGAVEYPAPKVKKADAKKLIKEGTLRISDGKVVLKDGTAVPGLTVTARDRQFKATTAESESKKD